MVAPFRHVPPPGRPAYCDNRLGSPDDWRGRLSRIHLAGRQALVRVLAHDLILGIGEASLELANPLPDRGPNLRQALRPEDEQHHQQDDHDLGKTEVSHGDLLEERPRDQVREHDPDQAQQGDVQAHRTQRES